MIQYVIFSIMGLDLYYCQPHKEFKLTTMLRNPPHLPTSAYSPQDTILHTQVVRLLPKNLKHIQSRE
jgi:hypothetical protein